MAFLILGIAYVNYLNLSSASILTRIKEIRMRKVLGAQNWQLAQQFMTETLVLLLIALGFSFLSVYLGMPVLESILGQNLWFGVFSTPVFWLVLLSVILVCMLISGFYVVALSGRYSKEKATAGGSSQVLRKALVVLQFVISISIICSTLIIRDQLNFMQSKDLGMKDLYKGVVPLQSGQVDQEIQHYLSRSEQVPSLVEIGVLLGQREWVDMAGGLLFQTLPGQDATILRELAGRMDDLPPVEQALAAGRSPEAILDQLLAGIPYEVLERRELSYRCSCSRERSAQAIKLLGRAEIESLIAEGEAVVDCHFCHERYIFERGELETLLEAIAG